MNCIYMLFQAMLIFEFFLTSITFMSPIFWFNNFWTLFPNNGSVQFNKFSQIFISIKTLLQWKICNITLLESSVIFCSKLAFLEPRSIIKTSPTYKYVTPPMRRPELCISRYLLPVMSTWFMNDP